MNHALLHALYVAVPLGTLALLYALFFARKGNHPPTYQLSEPWTHPPVLWAATDEAIPGHHGGGVNVGGGASGRW